MLAPFVARADPAKPLQQELNEVWDRICKHEWSMRDERCVKCGVTRQSEFVWRQHSVEVHFTPRQDAEIYRRAHEMKRDIDATVFNAKYKP